VGRQGLYEQSLGSQEQEGTWWTIFNIYGQYGHVDKDCPFNRISYPGKSLPAEGESKRSSAKEWRPGWRSNKNGKPAKRA